MTKRNKFYQIGFIVSTIVCIGLMLAMGIIAIQKQMKLNMSFQMNPSIVCKIYAGIGSDSNLGSDETLIFSNVDGDLSIHTNWTINANTLSYDNAISDVMGQTIYLKVVNYTDCRVLIEPKISDIVQTSKVTVMEASNNSGTTDETTFSVGVPGSSVTGFQLNFTQAFSITETVSNADITSYTNAYKIDGVYYAKAGETPTFTFTSEDYYTNPPAGLTAEGTAYSYEGGIMTLTEISGNATIKGEASASSYTITYNTDGGSAVSAQNYTYKADIITLAAAPTKDNYDFTGWKVSATAGSWIEGTTYTAGQTITDDMHGNVTLVAQWKAKGYTLTYNANPVSTYADNDITPPTQGSMNTSEYQQGVSKKLTTNGFTMPKGTYNSAGTFLGWSEDPNATKATYTDGQSITISQDTTLYAVWDYVWTIKAYNQTNVTTGYNSNFAEYYYVEMGEYPQTYASDYASKTYAEMVESSSSYEDNYLSDGTGQGVLSSGDICTINGERYYFQNSMPYYNSSGATTTYYTNYTSGWYKFEPIRWIIIGAGSDNMSETYGTGATIKVNGEVPSGDLMLISELTLYATQFDRTHYTDSTTSNNRYYTGDANPISDVYYSINTGFNTIVNTSYYRDAPDAAHMREGKHFAVLSGLYNYYDTYINKTSMTKTTSYYGTEDTSQHYIFLMGGVSGDSYYISNYLDDDGTADTGSDTMRLAYSSDFAKATSVYKNSSTGASYWWLRSGGSSYAFNAYNVYRGGDVYSYFVYDSDRGVRPSFILNLAQAL